MADTPRRTFKWGLQTFADPDPDMPAEAVRDMLAEIYPELTTAAIEITGGDSGEVTFTQPGTAVAKTGGQTVTFKQSQGTRG